MLELYLLLLLCLLTTAYLFFHTTEGFQDTNPSISAIESLYYLKSCPAGYNSFTLSSGSIGCCDSEVIGQTCSSANACVLGTDSSLPSCVKMLLTTYQEKAKSKCPPSMTSYYEDNVNKVKGCTNGQLNATLNGPQSATQSKCLIYPDNNREVLDSCLNLLDMEEFPCFGTSCTKELIQPKPNAPVLIAVKFTDPAGLFHVSYTRASYERYLNATQPNWKDKGTDLSKNIHVAEVAKAFYVDRTMESNAVQL